VGMGAGPPNIENLPILSTRGGTPRYLARWEGV
jgi:hypothetical protein